MARDDIGPTDETRAKLRPDPLREKLLAGHIGPIDFDVALDIREAVRIITFELQPKGQWQVGIWSNPNDDVNDPKPVMRYRRWLKAMGVRSRSVRDVLDAIETVDWRIGTGRVRGALRLYSTINGDPATWRGSG